MKFNRTYTLHEISQLINCEYVGDEKFPVKGMNEIHVVEAGDIVFVDHPKYYDKALESAATIILINKNVACPKGKALLISEDPFNDFNKLSRHFKPFQPSVEAISKTSKIGKGTIIQPNVFIGNNVTIGEHCLIHPNVSIYDNTVIGDHVVIHSGSVLGADAFYFKNREEGFDKLVSVGNVVIEDHVEIGASCTIDKGVTGATTLGTGTKIDNLIQIGHDTVVGKKCLIASQTAIAGCTVIEDEVTIWGQVGIVSGVRIGKGAVLLAKAGVSKDLEGGKTYFGVPCEDIRKKYKEMAAIKALPDIIKKVNNIS